MAMSLAGTLLFLMLVSGAAFSASPNKPPTDLSLKKSLGQPEGSVWLTRGWSYMPGDSLSWKDPDYDDSGWAIVPSRQHPEDFPGGWTGIGWFRQEVELDSAGFEPPLAMMLMVAGALEVYIDGELVYAIGKVSDDPETEIAFHHYRPTSIPLVLDSGKHLIAVRQSHWDWKLYNRKANNPVGFWIWLGEARAMADLATHRTRMLSKNLYFFTGAAFAFALLHLLLFLYYPVERAHLYYAVHTIGIAVLTYVGFSTSFISDPSLFLKMMWVFKLAVLLAMVYALRFTYSVFYDRLPITFRVLVPIAITLGVIAWWIPLAWIYFFTLVLFAEMIRVIIISIFHRRSGAWIVGLGLTALVVASTIQIINELTMGPDGPRVENVYLYGVMAFLVSMSILLARNSARTKQSLMEQVEHVRELSLKSLEQERRARDQEVERLRLAQENERVERELEMAHEREQMLSKLEETNLELQASNKHLRDTQAQLVQSEKMASLGSLVAGIAHEINTPIGAVGSMHDTLERSLDKLRDHLDHHPCESEEDHRRLERVLKVIDEANRVIRGGIERVTTIVRRLRSFARLDEAELKRASVEEGLEDTLTLIHHEIKHGIHVIREYGNVGQINCYPGRLNQVFLNLLNNARQAMEGEGTITVRTRVEKEWAVIEIADTGSGIPEDKLSRIFDPGFTTKGVKVGTGLGLSITYKIIEEHQGRIEVASEVGKGTTFSIYLPLNLQEPARS